MHALPPVQILKRRAWLPMSSGAARLLLRAVAGGVSRDEWATAIRLDPALASWLLFEFHQTRLRDDKSLTASSSDSVGADLLAGFVDEACRSGKLRSMLIWPAGFAEPQWDWEWSALGDQAGIAPCDAREWLRDDNGKAFVADESEGAADSKDAQTEKKWLDDLFGSLTIDSASPKQAGSGDLGRQRCDWWREDAELGAVLVTVAAKIRWAGDVERDFDQKLERSKLDAMKELAYGASHEINNPLANISSRAQTLLVDEEDPDRQRALAAINRQAFRAFEMIADMMLFAHPPRLEYTQFAIDEVVAEVLKEMQSDIALQQTDIKFESADGADGLVIEADRTQIGVVIKALVRNSLESLGEGGNVRVVASCPVAGMCEVSVMDDGPGISDEIRKHVFDPFYSGREAGRGLGFGLSKVWRIAEQHGGSVVISRNESDTGVGPQTCVSVNLPVRRISSHETVSSEPAR